MTHVVLPDIDSTEISAFINGIILFFIKSVDVVCARNSHIPLQTCLTFFLDCGQQLDHPSYGQALSEDTQSMDTTEIEKIFFN